MFENFGDVVGIEVSLAIQAFKMVFLRQRYVLRNFEPHLRKWKLRVLHDGAFEGFYGSYFCPCSCCSVEKEIYRFRLSMSNSPYNKPSDGCANSGQ